MCSFILFEVLDVDGSDFPTPPATTTPIKLAEPAHEIKRALLSGPAQLWMLLSIIVLVAGERAKDELMNGNRHCGVVFQTSWTLGALLAVRP